jgi:nitroimidazol reductase NimA-like FMN-containing flavoprotein (pyridoxamine 5'-phosphate oxidase superfamily)
MNDLRMSRQEREAFLTGPHVAAVTIADGTRGPLVVPVWYRYEPGGKLYFVTGGKSRKMPLLRRSGRLSVLVQNETLPYRYVGFEGPAEAVGSPDYERDVRAVAIRYLGPELGEAYLASTVEDRAAAEEVLVAARPERWWTADFAKMGI